MGRLDPYVELLAAFVEQGSMDGSTFEKRFLELFKSDQTMFPDDEFLVLDELFGVVDAFEADPALRGDDYLDEHNLRVNAADALTKLRGFVSTS